MAEPPAARPPLPSDHPPLAEASLRSRRQRIHELVLALLAQQGDLELLDGDGAALSGNPGEAGQWLERNRRVVARYQALVRSAVTLDALIDQDSNGQL